MLPSIALILCLLAGVAAPQATSDDAGVREGTFTSWTVEEYCSRFTGRPAADEASRRRTIDSVDGGWRIANEVYVAKPAR